MSNERFWDDMERAFANEDNARFDNEQLATKHRRKTKMMTMGLALGILLSVFAAFFIAGGIIFRVMPLPPEKERAAGTYSSADRAGLWVLTTISR